MLKLITWAISVIGISSSDRRPSRGRQAQGLSDDAESKDTSERPPSNVAA